MRGLGLICGIQLDQARAAPLTLPAATATLPQKMPPPFLYPETDPPSHCPPPPPPCLVLQMAGPLAAAARDRGLIVITAGKGDIVRLVPPLIVSDDDIAECCQVLGEVARELLV